MDSEPFFLPCDFCGKETEHHTMRYISDRMMCIECEESLWETVIDPYGSPYMKLLKHTGKDGKTIFGILVDDAIYFAIAFTRRRGARIGSDSLMEIGMEVEE
jgi:hypothetical protein